MTNRAAAAVEKPVGVEEMSAHLGVSRNTVCRLAAEGLIPAVKVGREWRFLISKVNERIAAGQKGAA
jgi:excisionase family DNA binding protein